MSLTRNEPTFLPFELLVGTRTPAGYPVTVIESPAGDGETWCVLETDDELRSALQVLEAGNVDQDFLVDLGAFLFDELFTGNVATLYRTSLGMARSQGKGLRVRLRIMPPELAALPWEYLHDLDEDAFLSIAAETALARYVPLRFPVRPTAVSLPLRVLAVIANPSGVRPLDVEQEKTILQDALAERGEQGRVQVEILERAVVADISQAMRRFQPHIFHFVGHGLFQDDTAYVVLEHEDGTANAVDEHTFGELFSGSKETRLAVLNACQTATVSSSQPLVGLAPRLLQRRLSAVVAMQYPVPDEASLIFTREFYRSLALGFPVDAAISEARRGIFLEMGAYTPAWGTPVLFLRAKDGRLFHPEEAEAAPIEIPAPPEPARPPEILGFVGRDAELADYAEKLESAHLAVIAGMAGVGKTALAVKLLEWVADDRDKVFWHTFHEGEGIDATIWSLAGFLAWHGRQDLWRLLQSTRLTGGQPPPLETLLDYVLQLVRGGNFLFCFDDFHHVDGDPALNHFVERLRSALLAGEVSIVITTRRVPDFATLVKWAPLEGLSSDDARRLLLARDVHLSSQQAEELHRLTEGNAEFLTLAIDALKQAKNPDLLLGRLAESDDIERYLLQEVDEGLTGQERAVMTTVAALLGYPGTRDAIEQILNGGNVWRVLRRLSDRHLLAVQDGEIGREYRQHDIVRIFYYEQASVRQRRQMHRRAGEYYETEDPDLLRAGLHFEQAHEYERAARLATQDVRGLINRGQARALLSLLERFKEQHVQDGLWAEVNLARAQTYTLLNDKQNASDCYNSAFEEAAALPDRAAGSFLSARACLGMGELLQDESPQDALDWLRRGLEEDGGANSQVEAALHIRAGYIQMQLGQYAKASASVDRGLNLLPPGPSQLRGFALLQLGSIHSEQGNSTLGQEYTRRALEMSRQLHDDFLTLRALTNQAVDRSDSGQWQEAIADLQQALILVERVGDAKARPFLEMNLGRAYMDMGDDEAALRHLLRCLELAQEQSDYLVEVHVQRNLAELHLRLGDLDGARQALARAEALTFDIEAQDHLPELYRIWAELDLAEDHLPEALDHAERAVRLAQDLGVEWEQGPSLRVWGQALFANGQYEIALNTFEQSLALLAEEPYEAARTQMYYGLALASGRDVGKGQSLIQQARLAFQQLNAGQDLAELEELVESSSYEFSSRP
jgi:tetratricopeptide (TPR) repeat protein